MANTISGLFGMQSPQQLQQDYLSGLMVSPAQMGQQGLLQQLASVGANAGAMMGYGGGRLLGGKVAGEVEAGLVNKALKDVNEMGIKDPAQKMAKLGEILSANPATAKQGMIALQEANKLKVQGYEMGAMDRVQKLQEAIAAIPADATEEGRVASMNNAIRQYGTPEQQTELAKQELVEAKKKKAIDNRSTALISSFGTAMDSNTRLSIASDNALFNKVMEDKYKYREQKTKVITSASGVQLVADPSGKVIKNYGLPPASSSVKVSIPASQTSYGKAVGEGKAKKDLAFVESAQSVAGSLPQMYETANLIATSDDLLTGIGSGVIKDFYRIVDQFTSAKEAGKKVSDTEYLDALMGREVFTQITALGIGARGLDTPAEREFLRSVMTGTTTLNEETLKKLTNLRITVAERAIKNYNEMLASGQLDRYMKESGEKLEPIEIPKRSSETEIASLISRLKANPQYSNLTDKQAQRALRKAGKIK